MADTLDRARDAVEAIAIEWNALPHVIGAAAALAPGAPPVWPEAVAPRGNLAFETALGDAGATARAFATAARTVTLALINQRLVANYLDTRGVVRIDLLGEAESGRRIEVGGVVTHRQRPATASGITFMNLEDESGTLNVIASVGVWTRYRRIAREAPAMIVRGILERSREGVVNLVADRFEPLTVSTTNRSRDFR